MLSADFEYDDRLLGVGLVIVNLVVFPVLVHLTVNDMRAHESRAKQAMLLQRQLLVDKAADRGRFDAVWARLCSDANGAEAQVLGDAAELARLYGSRPKQLNEFNHVDGLLAEAAASDEAFHATARELVESVGGFYDRGPLKKQARVLEKCYTDYGERLGDGDFSIGRAASAVWPPPSDVHPSAHPGGDLRMVVDIVRASAVFPSLKQLALVFAALLDPSCALIVVRAKDRLNNPTSFG